MNIKTCILLLFSFLTLLVTNGQTTDTLSIHQTDRQGTTFYTCSMHPEIISIKQGYCPKCGMQLTVKSNHSDSSHGNMSSMMMHSMSGSNHKRKIPMLMIMGVMMAIMAIVAMVGHNK